MDSQPACIKEALISRAVLVLPSSICARLKYVQDGFLFFIALSTLSLFVPTYFCSAEAATMDLDFGKDGLSATIEQSSLKTVIEKIAEKEDIWIKGAAHLSERKYSVEFEDVNIREALERMLEPFNCCYFIDGEGALVGIIIVNKKRRRGLPQRGPIPRNIFRGGRRR